MVETKVYQIYINGAFIASKETILIIHSSSKEVISYIPKGMADDVKAAV